MVRVKWLTVDKEIRSKEHPNGKRTVEKPVAVEKYMNMAGVDCFYQICWGHTSTHTKV